MPHAAHATPEQHLLIADPVPYSRRPQGAGAGQTRHQAAICQVKRDTGVEFIRIGLVGVG
jgi:hypothetical protein